MREPDFAGADGWLIAADPISIADPNGRVVLRGAEGSEPESGSGV